MSKLVPTKQLCVFHILQPFPENQRLGFLGARQIHHANFSPYTSRKVEELLYPS
jgi:hypothetical protein